MHKWKGSRILDIEHFVTTCCLQIVHNYDKISESESYTSLSKREVDMIAKESFNMHKRYKELLQELSDSSLIDPRWGSYRRRGRST